MSLRALTTKLRRLEARARLRERAEPPLLTDPAADRARLLALAGMDPDPWQLEVLRSDASRFLLLAGRSRTMPSWPGWGM